jgi:hypothetical protein
MVMTSAGTGKYLSKRWNKMHEEALIDRTRFSAEELTWLEITATQGLGMYDKERFVVDVIPIDQHAPIGPPRTTKRIDIRQRPECGDD